MRNVFILKTIAYYHVLIGLGQVHDTTSIAFGQQYKQ